MNFPCPSCQGPREIASTRVDGAALWARCATCGAESRFLGVPVPREEAASRVVHLRPVSVGPTREEPFRAPVNTCPKCISPKEEGALTCSACGLVFDNYREEEQALGDELESAWRVLLEGWEDPAAHDQLLSLAARTGSLAQVGRLYRIQLAHAPADPHALRGRDEVLRLAAVVAGGQLKADVSAPVAIRWGPASIAAVLGGLLLCVWVFLKLLGKL